MNNRSLTLLTAAFLLSATIACPSMTGATSRYYDAQGRNAGKAETKERTNDTSGRYAGKVVTDRLFFRFALLVVLCDVIVTMCQQTTIA